MEEKFMLFNSLTHREEEIVPYVSGKIKMYTCGPTVYHFAHIGNLRTYIMEDVLEKALAYVGFDVTRAMNITDVGHLTNDSDTGDDKMLIGAKRENKSVMQIARYYTETFFQDCRKLNIKKPEIIVPATSCISEYIKMIDVLFDKGYAYKAGGNVYFDTSKVNNYYAFSEQESDDLLVGVRDDVEEDKNKRNRSDFALWFTKSKFDAQELKWDSPWGIGYPGWHIECSAISLNYLGEYLDLHCGGVDNIFPHHTNEIAQSEAYLGHGWCKYWFHVSHLVNKEGKMSKSGNNFITVSSLEEKGYDPMVYRLFCLQSHYRKPLQFSYEVLDNMAAAYQKLKKKVAQIPAGGGVDSEALVSYRNKFTDALCNDLNTSMAITVLYEAINSKISDATKRELIMDFDQVLGLNLTTETENQEKDSELEEYIKERLDERKEAKQKKDFKKADQIREELASRGILIEDTREGTRWRLSERKIDDKR